MSPPAAVSRTALPRGASTDGSAARVPHPSNHPGTRAAQDTAGELLATLMAGLAAVTAGIGLAAVVVDELGPVIDRMDAGAAAAALYAAAAGTAVLAPLAALARYDHRRHRKRRRRT